MNEFVSWCRHLLVSFLFHALTSLHPPSFYRNYFSTCNYSDWLDVTGSLGARREGLIQDKTVRETSLSSSDTDGGKYSGA